MLKLKISSIFLSSVIFFLVSVMHFSNVIASSNSSCECNGAFSGGNGCSSGQTCDGCHCVASTTTGTTTNGVTSNNNSSAGAASSYYSLYQKTRNYSYKNVSGETVNQERSGYKNQNNLDSISVYETASFAKYLPEEYELLTQLSKERGTEHKLLKYYIPPGTKKLLRVSSSLSDNFSEFVFVARIGTPPGDYTTYAKSLSETEFLKLPSENGFTMSQLKAGDCIGGNSVGYIFVVNDNVSTPISDGAWLYVQYIRRSGNASNVYTSFENTIDTSSYLSWYNSYNNWQSNGDPAESSTNSSCASTTCLGNSCWNGTEYVQGTKTESCATGSATVTPNPLILPNATEKITWTTTNASKVDAQCYGLKDVAKGGWFINTAACHTAGYCDNDGYQFKFNSTTQTGQEVCVLFPYNKSDGKSGTPFFAIMNINASASAKTDGQCGTANKTYDATATSWGSDTFCAQGTASSASPTFPTVSAPATWTCQGTNGGADINCVAQKQISVKTSTESQSPSYICQPDDANCPETTCAGTYCNNGCALVPGKKKCK